MNNDLLPKAYRYLIWAIVAAIFALIGLTGYIAIQVASIDKEMFQLLTTMFKLESRIKNHEL
mgnify:CR=1 FL=1